MPVKIFENRVNIWRNYDKNLVAYFLASGNFVVIKLLHAEPG